MTITLDRPVHTSTATAISYRDLTPQQQAGWDQLLTDTYDATDAFTIKALHRAAATWLGIQLPDGDELVECSCEMCPDACDRIAPLSLCAEYLDGDTQRPQCPACAADHRITSD
ncbi:hypothetical protein AB0B07_33405 [Streptomyces sioyaensis]|uniref:hypothetical protein n=1 Tax=Streptomyces sioyaensis TaxID=67364 RepID=UPI0033EA14AA